MTNEHMQYVTNHQLCRYVCNDKCEHCGRDVKDDDGEACEEQQDD